MFSLPTNFVTDISTNSTAVLSALSPVVTLIIGVLLAGAVLTLIINAIKK